MAGGGWSGFWKLPRAWFSLTESERRALLLVLALGLLGLAGRWWRDRNRSVEQPQERPAAARQASGVHHEH